MRSLETKDKVRLEFKNAPVMTVEECKGLEFQDCIIYNFFCDSSANARVLWLGILNWLTDVLPKLNHNENYKVLGQLPEGGYERLLECALAYNLKLDKDDLPSFEASK